ncbi:M23 family metallopeptidase [Candidatus Haliotispira prima]|uniref:M23 family metallopeptidase n=1 Tax=Candidatus Haliotispira prima TaxID=3034016 RepID=A0ABY8MGG7_9SPIO|nr:M23 family metallopeptidase [Candidatus Haliotispira prima]
MPDEQKSELNILQRDVTYIKEFPDYGSYVSCILMVIQQWLDDKIPAHKVDEWYQKCLSNKAISHDEKPIKEDKSWHRCFVNSFIEAFNTGMKIFGGTYEAVEANDENPANIQIYEWLKCSTDNDNNNDNDNKSHFTCGTPRDKKQYDSDPDTKLETGSTEKFNVHIRKATRLPFKDAFGQRKLRRPTKSDKVTGGWYDYYYGYPAKSVTRAKWMEGAVGRIFAKTLPRLLFHNGLDLRAAAGAPIYACYEGIVCFIEQRNVPEGRAYHSNYGWYVVISHGEGWYSLYAHLKKPKRELLQKSVSAGQIIGHSGEKGTDHGYDSHLHLEIRQRLGESGEASSENTGWLYPDPEKLLYHNPLLGLDPKEVDLSKLGKNKMKVIKGFGEIDTDRNGMNIIFKSSTGRILSPVDGTVLRDLVDSYAGEYGAHVIIKANGYHHYFCHLKEWDDSLLVKKVGEVKKIKEGEPIGWAGSSRWGKQVYFTTPPLDKPHLHYRIKPENPDTGNGNNGFINPAEVEGVDLRLLSDDSIEIIKEFEEIPRGQNEEIGHKGLDITFSNGVVFSPVDGEIEFERRTVFNSPNLSIKISTNTHNHYFYHLKSFSDAVKLKDPSNTVNRITKGQYLGRFEDMDTYLKRHDDLKELNTRKKEPAAHVPYPDPKQGPLHYRIRPKQYKEEDRYKGYVNPADVVDLRLLLDSQMKIINGFYDRDLPSSSSDSTQNKGLDIDFSNGLVFSPVDGKATYVKAADSSNGIPYVSILAEGHDHQFYHLENVTNAIRLTGLTNSEVKIPDIKKGDYLGHINPQSTETYLHYRIEQLDSNTGAGSGNYIDPESAKGVDLLLLGGAFNP